MWAFGFVGFILFHLSARSIHLGLSHWMGRQGAFWRRWTRGCGLAFSNGDEVSGLPVYSMDSGKTSCGPQKNTTIDTKKKSQFERGWAPLNPHWIPIKSHKITRAAHLPESCSNKAGIRMCRAMSIKLEASCFLSRIDAKKATFSTAMLCKLPEATAYDKTDKKT